MSTVLRKGIHSLYRDRLKVSCMNGVHFGLNGFRASVIPACCGVRPPFLRLHSWQEQTTFSHTEVPPWERGITWSRFNSCREIGRATRLNSSHLGISYA